MRSKCEDGSNMIIKGMVPKVIAALLSGALVVCSMPMWAIAAEQTQEGAASTAQAAERKVIGSFDSCVGLSTQCWCDVPQIKTARNELQGIGETASSLASYRTLFQAVHAYGSELLEPYEGGTPVLLQDGHHFRMSADALDAAKAALDAAKAAARVNTAAAYYDQAKAVIGAVNAALCGVEAASDADALKLIWDGRALEQISDEAVKSVQLPKGAKATAKASSLSIAAPLSQSGAAASFSKGDGPSKINVSRSGKCTLKKGVRKGTYSAQVRVAYSADTWKLVAVTFEVR